MLLWMAFTILFKVLSVYCVISDFVLTEEELEKLRILEEEEANRKTLEEKIRDFESTLRKGQGDMREYAHLERGFVNYAMFSPPSYVL